ncbi:SDR family NAD(P)-dependent oxidoreductase [Bacillus mobilis]|uniref:SDR family oxidoreductase n=2 Tax=Bacillus cereus group TaxID=86661 RepID=A0A1Q4LI16_BACCE|nr:MULTISPECIES: SDR family NAD(P)-dependent oxidoreductase [Bacillus cereus group]MCC2463343.1 SDR family NAD(P)-dependent oxidoreductase [Bacillus mobilis]MCU5432310.1 SDR family NAD(P)-dependent oxidoreductase [Bacillus mobilis]MCU5590808.1 SDR family NAD(P)-dependent oxidoreductase [Bacillus mobilis]MCU5734418.1 SDR family NAD(P)-dependent oxidoreductase [Bacillus mobilis]MCU9557083.1 SDR family NAD(P)-dependent oxidoreductase [Bacillus mobilis]
MTVRLIEGVMKMKLAGKVAIVTGGGIGIGRNTALLLAKQGAKVIVTDIDQESGQATVEEITNLGGEALFVSYDMEKQGDWQRVISITLNAFSRIDMLFQNAGLYKIDPIFSRQQENDSNVLCINDVWIEIKQLTSSFMKQQEEVVLNDLPIFGIIGTKGQSFHTVEALV